VNSNCTCNCAAASNPAVCSNSGCFSGYQLGRKYNYDYFSDLKVDTIVSHYDNTSDAESVQAKSQVYQFAVDVSITVVGTNTKTREYFFEMRINDAKLRYDEQQSDKVKGVQGQVDPRTLALALSKPFYFKQTCALEVTGVFFQSTEIQNLITMKKAVTAAFSANLRAQNNYTVLEDGTTGTLQTNYQKQAPTANCGANYQKSRDGTLTPEASADGPQTGEEVNVTTNEDSQQCYNGSDSSGYILNKQDATQTTGVQSESANSNVTNAQGDPVIDTASVTSNSVSNVSLNNHEQAPSSFLLIDQSITSANGEPVHITEFDSHEHFHATLEQHHGTQFTMSTLKVPVVVERKSAYDDLKTSFIMMGSRIEFHPLHNDGHLPIISDSLSLMYRPDRRIQGFRQLRDLLHEEEKYMQLADISGTPIPASRAVNLIQVQDAKIWNPHNAPTLRHNRVLVELHSQLDDASIHTPEMRSDVINALAQHGTLQAQQHLFSLLQASLISMNEHDTYRCLFSYPFMGKPHMTIVDKVHELSTLPSDTPIGRESLLVLGSMASRLRGTSALDDDRSERVDRAYEIERGLRGNLRDAVARNDPDHAEAVLGALENCGHGMSTDAVFEMLDHHMPNVRSAAVSAFRTVPHPYADEILLKTFLDPHEHTHTRLMALRTLTIRKDTKPETSEEISKAMFEEHNLIFAKEVESYMQEKKANHPAAFVSYALIQRIKSLDPTLLPKEADTIPDRIERGETNISLLEFPDIPAGMESGENPFTPPDDYWSQRPQDPKWSWGKKWGNDDIYAGVDVCANYEWFIGLHPVLYLPIVKASLFAGGCAYGAIFGAKFSILEAFGAASFNFDLVKCVLGTPADKAAQRVSIGAYFYVIGWKHFKIGFGPINFCDFIPVPDPFPQDVADIVNTVVGDGPDNFNGFELNFGPMTASLGDRVTLQTYAYFHPSVPKKGLNILTGDVEIELAGDYNASLTITISNLSSSFQYTKSIWKSTLLTAKLLGQDIRVEAEIVANVQGVLKGSTNTLVINPSISGEVTCGIKFTGGQLVPYADNDFVVKKGTDQLANLQVGGKIEGSIEMKLRLVIAESITPFISIKAGAVLAFIGGLQQIGYKLDAKIGAYAGIGDIPLAPIFEIVKPIFRQNYPADDSFFFDSPSAASALTFSKQSSFSAGPLTLWYNMTFVPSLTKGLSLPDFDLTLLLKGALRCELRVTYNSPNNVSQWGYNTTLTKLDITPSGINGIQFFLSFGFLAQVTLASTSFTFGTVIIGNAEVGLKTQSGSVVPTGVFNIQSSPTTAPINFLTKPVAGGSLQAAVEARLSTYIPALSFDGPYFAIKGYASAALLSTGAYNLLAGVRAAVGISFASSVPFEKNYF